MTDGNEIGRDETYTEELDKLPAEQQAKNYIFRGVVHAMAKLFDVPKPT